MNVFDVIAIHDIDFTDRKTNEHIVGTQFWVGCISEDPAWHGYKLIKHWFAPDNPLRSRVQALCSGSVVQFVFNERGKPVDFTVR